MASYLFFALGMLININRTMATDTHVQQAKDHIHLLHSLSLVLLSDLSSSMNSNSSKPSPAVREMPVTRKGKHVGTPRRKSSDVQVTAPKSSVSKNHHHQIQTE